ncbi:hypothetical protein CLV51_104385 [Chitinophaga niastensis]|uniref:Uncharacterized protein n=1 Tax=Chitinophaga niastensis TaxID=536980 RepID=A0A2P8HHH1_CHINA|nr:hypothetical protein [Chitinophaga niastensis]PSL45678.1 hypothetical protein CLV51_104385 [Chitinophaga niastensis]
MKYFIFLALIFAGFLLIQGCAVQNHATTVERDKENGCTIHVILQIGIEGTDADVIAVRDQLEECYSKKCVIPCENDNSVGCPVLSHVNVKKWSALSDDEKKSFHHITMVNNDGQPSNAHIGTPNGGPKTGTWRRDEPPRTYCHEVLHLAGLKDQYCSRVYDTVTHTSVVEVTCDPPPDPDGNNCCTATAAMIRCGQPCPGHNNDLMATLTPELSCDNILDVVKKAGLNSCPEACCPHHHTYYNPKNLIFIGPSYVHFGDKDLHYGSYGGTGEYTHFFTPKIGATVDIGIYFHNDKQNELTTHYQQWNATAGITFIPITKPKPHVIFSTHALFGISTYSYKFTGNGFTSNKTSQHSFTPNIGVALDWPVSKSFAIRLVQADYMPTFFSKSTQNNFRISIGAAWMF